MSKSRRSTSGTMAAVMLGAAAVAAIGLIGAAAAQSEPMQRIVLVAAGVVGLIVVAAVLGVAMSMRTSAGRGGGTMPADGQVAAMLAEIHQHTMLSDAAKRVLYRDRELDLLRRAIEDDIARGQYSAGLTLCDDMANLFGNREEAEAFRSRIIQARHDHYEAEVRAAMDQFQQMTATRDWAGAHREAARIRRLYPDSHYVNELDQRIMAAREEHKRELESRFLDAARREDVEQGMQLLRQLDRYLSPEEAAKLRQTALSVVTRHRENLGMQFKLAVNDHRWAEAARIGQAIIDEFPNTKMADEVRGMLDMIQTRASQSAVAARP